MRFTRTRQRKGSGPAARKPGPARLRAGLGAAALVALSLQLCGCALNPVTGKSELHLFSENWEREIGDTQYLPTQQIEGGRYTLDPELGGYVSEVGKRIAALSDRPDFDYEFVVLNNSVPNAWALPGGKVAVNRGLLVELNNEAELAAVLAHEIVHVAARHSAGQAEKGILMQAAAVGVGMAVQGESYANLVLGAAGVGAGLIKAGYSREAELEADHYGMLYAARAGYDPGAAVTVQETFVRLAEARRQDWLSGMFASHPPSQERVDANRRTAATLPAGGIVGAQRYEEHVARIRADRDAYAAYDEGQKALAAGDGAKALKSARSALSIQPRESRFYGLLGAAYEVRGDERSALSNYDKAVDLDGAYFEFYLRRGLLLKKLGRNEQARADIERSAKILPTTVAHAALGDIAKARGDFNAAVDHYSAAANSNTPAGQHAARALAQMVMKDKPERYVSASLLLDRRGRLLVEVGNVGPVTVEAVAVEVSVRGPGGDFGKQKVLRVNGRLEPGTATRLATGAGPFENPDEAKRFHVRVISARPLP